MEDIFNNCYGIDFHIGKGGVNVNIYDDLYYRNLLYYIHDIDILKYCDGDMLSNIILESINKIVYEWFNDGSNLNNLEYGSGMHCVICYQKNNKYFVYAGYFNSIENVFKYLDENNINNLKFNIIASGYSNEYKIPKLEEFKEEVDGNIMECKVRITDNYIELKTGF